MKVQTHLNLKQVKKVAVSDLISLSLFSHCDTGLNVLSQFIKVHNALFGCLI